MAWTVAVLTADFVVTGDVTPSSRPSLRPLDRRTGMSSVLVLERTAGAPSSSGDWVVPIMGDAIACIPQGDEAVAALQDVLPKAEMPAVTVSAGPYRISGTARLRYASDFALWAAFAMTDATIDAPDGQTIPAPVVLVFNARVAGVDVPAGTD